MMTKLKANIECIISIEIGYAAQEECIVFLKSMSETSHDIEDLNKAVIAALAHVGIEDFKNVIDHAPIHIIAGVALSLKEEHDFHLASAEWGGPSNSSWFQGTLR